MLIQHTHTHNQYKFGIEAPMCDVQDEYTIDIESLVKHKPREEVLKSRTTYSQWKKQLLLVFFIHILVVCC